MNNKLDVLNALKVSDWSVASGEVEYVLTERTDDTVNALLAAGFTGEEIQSASDEYESDNREIDLSALAFQVVGANWWSLEEGFSIEVRQ